MRIVNGAEEGRLTLLKREPLEGAELPAAVRETIRRVFGSELDAASVVDVILRDVRDGGDGAVRKYNHEIDGVSFSGSLEVPEGEIRRAYDGVEQGLVEALRVASERISAYHRQQLKHAAQSFEHAGTGQLVRPIKRVGLYIPGTKVIYPSTILMTAIPARVAGARELVMVTPAREDGSVAPLKLIAADIAGVDRVFRAGGVQGIGALAYGTETVPQVDKICGPGNVFVTLAKKRLYGEVGIDGIFGPSETLVIADEQAEARQVAADMLAGAEHDELATAILVTCSGELATEVAHLISKEIPLMARSAVAQESLDARGGAVVVESIEEAMRLANEFGPEHLCMHVESAERWLDYVQNAGCVFVGEYSVESIGDYTAGPSHVMPTGGSARFTSALGVHDFLKVTSLVRFDRGTAAEVGPAGVAIAYAEGLTGHARAIEGRLDGDG